MQFERKNIDEMTKCELKFELECLRNEYDMLKFKDEIMKMVDRMVTTMDLKKIKDYTEIIYKESVVKEWGFYYGVRDNLCDMVNNLSDNGNIKALQYFNTLMYGVLLNEQPENTNNLYTMTDEMTKLLLEHLQKGGASQ